MVVGIMGKICRVWLREFLLERRVPFAKINGWSAYSGQTGHPIQSKPAG